MAKLIDCLSRLPDDMLMIDQAEIDRKKMIKTVAELKKKCAEDNGEYELVEVDRNYGKTKLKAIVSSGIHCGIVFLEERKPPDMRLFKSVEDFGFSTRVCNALKKQGVENAYQIKSLGEFRLAKIQGISLKTARAIVSEVRRQGARKDGADE